MRPIYLVVTAALVLALAPIPAANATVNSNLLFNLDARSSSSVNPTNLATLSDLTGHYPVTNGGGVTFDAKTRSLAFDASDESYLQVSRGFSDLRNGFTIEVRGSLGTDVNSWERLVDFGSGEEQDNIAISRLATSNRLVFEVWVGSSRVGRAETIRSFPNNGKLMSVAATLGTDLIPHVYVNGAEQKTVISWNTIPGKFDALPRLATRSLNYIGRSNWLEDSRLEGLVQYVRIYNTPLLARQIKFDAKIDRAYKPTQ